MDPITDILLLGYTGEEIVGGAVAIYTQIEEFLGYEGMQAAYNVIHELGENDLMTILPQISFADGEVSVIGGQLLGFTAESAANILSAIRTLSGILLQKGVDLTTAAGKEVLGAIMEAIKKYGFAIGSTALTGFIGKEVSNYRSKQTYSQSQMRPF